MIPISNWLSKLVSSHILSKTKIRIQIPLDIFEYILEFVHITSPNWKQGVVHSKLVKKQIIKLLVHHKLKLPKQWYGHFWSLYSVPWVDTYWSGVRGLEYESFPLKSTSNFIITRMFINNELCYFGQDSEGCLFPLTEPFPEWCSKIIKKNSGEYDLNVRQISTIHSSYL
jgi:hypothetical protein